MVASAMVLKCALKLAFYNGLLHQSIVPDSVPETVNGWRNVNADGQDILPAECFVACNQFYALPSNVIEFEQRWHISHHVGLPDETTYIRGGHSMGRNRDLNIEHVVRS